MCQRTNEGKRVQRTAHWDAANIQVQVQSKPGNKWPSSLIARMEVKVCVHIVFVGRTKIEMNRLHLTHQMIASIKLTMMIPNKRYLHTQLYLRTPICAGKPTAKRMRVNGRTEGAAAYHSCGCKGTETRGTTARSIQTVPTASMRGLCTRVCALLHLD